MKKSPNLQWTYSNNKVNFQETSIKEGLRDINILTMSD